MRPEPKLTRAAGEDVLRAADYYNAQKPGLGLEFLDEIEDTTSLIREAPLLFTVVDAPIRRALSHRFPYGVFYVPGADGEPDVIVAVVSSRPRARAKAFSR